MPYNFNPLVGIGLDQSIPLDSAGKIPSEYLLSYVKTDTTGVTGADQVTNIISLTQAEYDAIVSPDANTFYVITA
jgi:hypothetical protein